MNLFDHYAGLAMQVELQQHKAGPVDAVQEHVAQRAYEMAAAMLRERNKVAMILYAIEGQSEV